LNILFPDQEKAANDFFGLIHMPMTFRGQLFAIIVSNGFLCISYEEILKRVRDYREKKALQETSVVMDREEEARAQVLEKESNNHHNECYSRHFNI